MSNKKNVISLEMNDEEMRMVERAAYCLGFSTSDYIIYVALKQANQDLNLSAMLLSNKDRDFVLKQLEEPVNPNNNLKDLLNN